MAKYIGFAKYQKPKDQRGFFQIFGMRTTCFQRLKLQK